MFIKALIWLWNNTGCVIVKEIMLPLLRSLTRLISSIVSFFNTGRDIVKFMWTIIHYMEKITCDSTINCNFMNDPPPNIELGALPVASRCWADYTPEIDTSDSFSCTRSDTCRVSGLEYGTTLDPEYGYLVEDGNQASRFFDESMGN